MAQKKTLFKSAFESYLEYSKGRMKKQGYDTVERNIRLHILPYFQDKFIEDLTKIDIVNWQTKILKKNFKNNFNRNLYYEFSAFIDYCLIITNLKENIVLQVKKFPKKFEKNTHHVFTLRQFRKFRRHLDNYIFKQYFNMMYFYGLRPSESMALRFCDTNKKELNIIHSLQRKGKREIDTPKNMSSIRTLKLTLLTRFRIWRLKKLYQKQYGTFKDTYFLFGGIKPLAPTTIDRYKKKACEKANLKPITQHEFRHSFATRKIHKGVPIDYVSKEMGHSTVSMTVDVYLHQ